MPTFMVWRTVAKLVEAAQAVLDRTASPGSVVDLAAALEEYRSASKVDTLKAAEVLYTNYRGETAKRRIVPTHVWFGSTEWHRAEQWFVDALDVEKGEMRSFALKDFGEPTNVARQEWREIYVLLQESKEPVAERREAPDGTVTMSMANVVRRILEERAEDEASFNLRWEADMRGIRAWREAGPGRGLSWPDHADLVTWLLEQRDALVRERDEAKARHSDLAVVMAEREKTQRSLLDDNYRGLRYVVYDEERAPLAAFKDEVAARAFYKPIKNSGFRTLPEALS